MGIATIVASIVYGSNSDGGSFSERVIRDALMYVGVDMIRSSQVRKQEKRLHTETLEELVGELRRRASDRWSSRSKGRSIA